MAIFIQTEFLSRKGMEGCLSPGGAHQGSDFPKVMGSVSGKAKKEARGFLDSWFHSTKYTRAGRSLEVIPPMCLMVREGR